MGDGEGEGINSQILSPCDIWSKGRFNRYIVGFGVLLWCIWDMANNHNDYVWYGCFSLDIAELQL